MPVAWPNSWYYTTGTETAAWRTTWNSTNTLTTTYNWYGSGGGGGNYSNNSYTYGGGGGGGGTWHPVGYLDGGLMPAPERERLAARQAVLGDPARETRRVARETAHVVAEELLTSMLTEDQRQSWRLNGYFEVIGSHGTLYRLHRGIAGNVEWLTPDGESGGRLCAHPTMRESWLPTADVLLAQLLALRTDEREWLALANVHAGRAPQLMRV